MKKVYYLLLFFLIIQVQLKAQNGNSWLGIDYRVGAGALVEGSWGMFGVNFTNEFELEFFRTVTLGTSLTYYKSIINSDLDYTFPEDKDEFLSGVFADFKAGVNVWRTQKGLRVHVAYGPSYQRGRENIHSGYYYSWELEREVSSGFYEDEFNRWGTVTQVMVEWPWKSRDDRKNSISAAMHSFDNYWPYYLLLTYRLAFSLK
ncbi:hypothetical protein [Mongoliitalea daihaiensis]|uniref:hypothetical protein n=1 Tax=Mongoliitalea daihaiensis TaxID=2782006 RepID=UPI001F420A67|nr:hypothetical protein [Mongoliitalea daihaiensis]UJP66458.1 hypothetical protein IPZ59_07625 [Mongoliitalea daihaiensis]